MPSPSERYVISWFGWDIRDHELYEDSDFGRWADCLDRLAGSMGLRIERFGNLIDVIIGKNAGSVSRHEFFAFQRGWDELNERLGFRMSGLLSLMNDDGKIVSYG